MYLSQYINVCKHIIIIFTWLSAVDIKKKLRTKKRNSYYVNIILMSRNRSIVRLNNISSKETVVKAYYSKKTTLVSNEEKNT